MTFDKFKQDDGYLIDGTFHDDAESVLSSKLNFCDCGAPEIALLYIQNILTLLDQQTKDILAQKESYNQPLKDFFRSEPERWFAFYVLDSFDLTEHGSSLSMGGWLTNKGKDYLADLNEYFES